MKGCNIPDIDIIIQWKLTATVSAFVQRAGHAARASGQTGLAVLLLEKSIYDADLDKGCQDEQKTKVKKTIRQSSNYPKVKMKKYAIKRGVLLGTYGSLSDKVATGIDVPIDVSSIDEGAYGLVKLTTCHRGVLTDVYGNEKAYGTSSPT
jgi:superfamily II DNA/RNA helicase